jgi:hypothetical protein
VNFTDVSLVFDASGGLGRVLLHRDSIKYSVDGPTIGPSRPLTGPVPPWPSRPPGPIDPLLNAQ